MSEATVISGQFLCRERRGVTSRQVREVEPTRQLEAYLCARLASIPSPLRDLSTIYDPGVRVLLVDDVGVMIKGFLDYDGCPDVHIGFWDRILVGREEMCYNVGRQLAADEGVPGVWTAIPKDARATIAFAKRVGFKVTQEAPTALAMVLLFHDATRRT